MLRQVDIYLAQQRVVAADIGLLRAMEFQRDVLLRKGVEAPVAHREMLAFEAAVRAEISDALSAAPSCEAEGEP